MEVKLDPDTYIAAVSGGVDSMALLHLLQQQPGLKLTVAHFDHGIRSDSYLDRQLVQNQAATYGLPFAYETASLGPTASEEAAREARYRFLRKVKKAAKAQAIITAHHQDDVIETAFINLQRGTGRRGLSSLQSRGDILRPLLHIPKAQLKKYAKDNQLAWREDSTNQDPTYYRNYLRLHVMPKLSAEKRQELLELLTAIRGLNNEIDGLLINQLHVQPAANMLDRYWFIMLPHAVAKEAMATWLRNQEVRSFDTKTLERLVTAAKTYAPDRQTDVNADYILIIGSDVVTLQSRINRGN